MGNKSASEDSSGAAVTTATVAPTTSAGKEIQKAEPVEAAARSSFVPDPLSLVRRLFGASRAGKNNSTKAQPASKLSQEVRNAFQRQLGERLTELHVLLLREQEKAQQYDDKAREAYGKRNFPTCETMVRIAKKCKAHTWKIANTIEQFEDLVRSLDEANLITTTIKATHQTQQFLKEMLAAEELPPVEQVLEAYEKVMEEMNDMREEMDDTMQDATQSAMPMSRHQLESYVQSLDDDTGRELAGGLEPSDAMVQVHITPPSSPITSSTSSPPPQPRPVSTAGKVKQKKTAASSLLI